MTNTPRYTESFFSCALLLLTVLVASCAAIDDATIESTAFDEVTSDVIRGAVGNATFVVTEEGIVRGIATHTTREFRGIPYGRAGFPDPSFM